MCSEGGGEVKERERGTDVLQQGDAVQSHHNQPLLRQVAAHVKPLSDDSNDTGQELLARVTQKHPGVCAFTSVWPYMAVEAMRRHSEKHAFVQAHAKCVAFFKFN